MSRWDSYEYDELADILSDYHKDVFGCRLRMYGEPREVIIEELDRIDRYMDNMQSTPEGRARLREDGWEISEPCVV
ncbi:MAG: hypothetical protein ACO29M_04905 [Fluviibacter sp.]